MLGDFSALLPQDRIEALLAAGSAVSAGITEELYFRLAVPLLIADLAGSAWLGFAVATLLFALAHRYQRWLGVVATGLIGALLAFLYLQSGALWLAMLVHATIDVNGLVVRPVLAGMLRRREV
jgi:membrane protease YdiL (CAAX protease family)